MRMLGGVFGDREQTRVAQHILRAEAHADQREVRLRPLQRLARKLLLAELAEYRARGRFPKNRDFEQPTPYFVDAAGTRCAVAHLLDASGESELVQRIAHERNHARVAELADEARLVAWLDVAGLSVEEAALIQPSYCFRPDPVECVCQHRSSGYFEVEKTATSYAKISLARVDVIHGEPYDTTVQVGDFVQVANADLLEIGTVLFLSGEATHNEYGMAIFSAVEFSFPFSCDGSEHELSKEQFLQAVLARDCKAHLRSSGGWEQPPPACDDSCSCRAVGTSAGSPTTLGVVLSLLGLAIARRMRGAAH